MKNLFSNPERIENRTWDRSRRGKLGIVVLACALVIIMFGCLLTGSADVSIVRLVDQFRQLDFDTLKRTSNYIILVEIRLPRVILGVLVGAALAVSGLLMQGLFRNPLADPGTVGVSAGAGLGAVAVIVSGQFLPLAVLHFFGPVTLLFGAFCGGLFVATLLYAIATSQGRTSVATMLLAGIAIAALAGAVSGFLIYSANDHELRDITFWNLGSLAGTSWLKVIIAAPVILLSLCFCPLLSRPLNALTLGEAVAGHLGFNVQLIKRLSVLLVSLMCGAAVSVSGGIGFIGIVVPHLLRLTLGPDHRYLIPCSALLGGGFLLFADSVARIIVSPAEMPIGIVTAAFGAPFFLWILLRQRGIVDL